MLSSLLRSSASATKFKSNLSAIFTITPTSTASQPSSSRNNAMKKAKSSGAKVNKSKSISKFDAKFKTKQEVSITVDDISADLLADDVRARGLPKDEKDKSLDVVPNGRPVFASCASLSQLTRKDTYSCMKFSMEELSAALPEGLPVEMVMEFEDSKQNALLIQNFLEIFKIISGALLSAIALL